MRPGSSMLTVWPLAVADSPLAARSKTPTRFKEFLFIFSSPSFHLWSSQSPPQAHAAREQPEAMEQLRRAPRRGNEPGLLCRRPRSGNRDSKQPPLPAHGLEGQIKTDLQWPRGGSSCQMHFATRVHKRLGAELRSQERGAKEIEVAAAQIGEALREIGRRVPGLEIRRGQIAEDPV